MVQSAPPRERSTLRMMTNTKNPGKIKATSTESTVGRSAGAAAPAA